MSDMLLRYVSYCFLDTLLACNCLYFYVINMFFNPLHAYKERRKLKTYYLQ